jgi:hypothetical protein
MLDDRGSDFANGLAVKVHVVSSRLDLSSRLWLNSVNKEYPMENKTFATAINCIDGRVQAPVTVWLKDSLKVDYVDTITEPGADQQMAEGSLLAREATRQKVLISVNAHGSRTIAVVGHHDCAGNPVSKDEHLRQIRKGVETVKTWDTGAEVVGLWVNEKWQVERVV